MGTIASRCIEAEKMTAEVWHKLILRMGIADTVIQNSGYYPNELCNQNYRWKHKPSYSSLHDISIACLKYFSVYGPCARPDMGAFNFLDKISRGKIQQYGDGKSFRDYVYVGNGFKEIILAMNIDFEYEIFDVATKEA